MRQYSLYVTTRQIVVLEIKLYNASEHRLRHTLVADYGTALPLSRQDLHLQASKSLAGRDYQRHALDVPFDRKVIQIREIGDSREGLPRGILKMLHRMRETKCRVKPFAVWLYVPKDIGIYGF